MCARAGFTPRQGMEAMTDGNLHQPVPRGVELDLVDAVAEPIVAVQLRRVGVGQKAPGDGLFGARQPAELGDHVLCPRPALSFEGFAQGKIGLEEVVVDERRWLVQRLPGLCAR